jgi:hypothetical protein
VSIFQCGTSACESTELILNQSGYFSSDFRSSNVYSSLTGFLKVTFTSDSPGPRGSGLTGTWSISGSSEYACTDCVAGKYSPTEGAPSYSNCTDCVAGKYASTAAVSACTNCACLTGQVQNGVCGGSSPGVCESCGTCPPGQNRIGCIPGSTGSCEACDTGKYKANCVNLNRC